MTVSRGVGFVPLDCSKCDLCRGRTQVVPAEGGSKPLAFFVGEAPGPDEDAQGRPFVGRAGKILRRSLQKAGWPEEDVWITNIVKCFPHEVVEGKRKIRAPEVSEADACRAHLRAELDALHPRLLVALGRTAATELTGRKIPKLDPVRGALLPTRPELGNHFVFLTFHPSGLHYGAGRLEAFEADLATARRLLTGMETRLL